MDRIVTPLVLVCVTFFLAPQPALAIMIPTVVVGNAGNGNDWTGFGAVAYPYRIGRTEVAVGQYTTFLNAVAATDTYALYNTEMQTNLNIAGISRSGSPGSYSYSVIGSANHPITFVSWGDAARFSNWLHNNQPTGLQDASTTERGAYTLDGAITYHALNAIPRNADARWFIPSENEWYKAAFHQPAAQGGDADNYWTYATRANSEPYSDQPPGSDAPTQSNTANIYEPDFLGAYNNGYAVTGSALYSSLQNYLTDVGAYTSSASPYGTFDQGGNVSEWNEAIRTSSQRGNRGGAWGSRASDLRASLRGATTASSEFNSIGFRVASVPGPLGDYNGDLVTNAADYAIWRDTLGQTGTGLAADGNGNNQIDIDDYDIWRAHFGQTAGSGAGTVSQLPGSAAANVPEPSVLLLLATGGLASILCFRNKKTKHAHANSEVTAWAFTNSRGWLRWL